MWTACVHVQLSDVNTVLIDTIPLASGVKWVVRGLTNALIVLAEMRNWLLSAKVEFGTFLQLAMLHVVK